jgi:hypothetical protein
MGINTSIVRRQADSCRGEWHVSGSDEKSFPLPPDRHQQQDDSCLLAGLLAARARESSHSWRSSHDSGDGVTRPAGGDERVPSEVPGQPASHPGERPETILPPSAQTGQALLPGKASGPGSVSSWRHCWIDGSEMPSSRATDAMGFPLVWASRTASRFNSGVEVF